MPGSEQEQRRLLRDLLARALELQPGPSHDALSALIREQTGCADASETCALPDIGWRDPDEAELLLRRHLQVYPL